jgi:hypothetical protein
MLHEDYDNSKAQWEMEQIPTLCKDCFEPLTDALCKECEYYDKLEPTINNMKNEIVKVETNQLEEVIKNSGLAIQEGEEIKAAYLPFLSRLMEIQEQSTKINFEAPASIDETIARELRLKAVKVRTDAEKLKDDQKRVDLLRGKIKQDTYNLIASSCKLAEDVFFNVEKAREIAEKKAKEQLRIDRSEKLSPYTESVALFQLGEMTEDLFSELYSSLRITHENKLVAEKKAEEARLAAIESERVKNVQIRLENEKLKKEADEKERALKAEREKAEAEKEKARKEQEEKDKKAEKERTELLASANAERIKRENLEAELKRKKDAELKQQEADKKAIEAFKKKEKLAPDKTKLLAFGQELNNIARPEIKSIEAAAIMSTINGYLAKLDKYIVDEASKL